jgi:predicted aspartyl protease
MNQFLSNNITVEPQLRTLITIYDVNKRNCQRMPVIIDTGATYSLIPSHRLLNLGYNLEDASPAPSQTPNGQITILFVTVTKIVAVGKSVENIQVTCREPDADIPDTLKRMGLLGLNFLRRFDNVNISFSGQMMILT